MEENYIIFERLEDGQAIATYSETTTSNDNYISVEYMQQNIEPILLSIVILLSALLGAWSITRVIR